MTLIDVVSHHFAIISDIYLQLAVIFLRYNISMLHILHGPAYTRYVLLTKDYTYYNLNLKNSFN